MAGDTLSRLVNGRVLQRQRYPVKKRFICPVFCLRINADEFDVLDGWLFGVDHTCSSAFHCADYAEKVSR